MRSTRTAKRATACLFVLAGLFVGAAGGLGTSGYSTTVTSADDMPWGIVKPAGPPSGGQQGDMPWG
ncbi:hypothetical protein NLX86_21620 [Streptomyces sp. A3M-1-3]|uniref:hypothetical protein n=1 Tax=Streptomyces sp. A3M-1-3 TaxID=2962044 RepID=UPI0020B85E59|nr:hypothetical protein [Streptomyces sp. A3M-1-3]MCP3820599.1 hypothetical protein [Streptomyces sp. A3M-1-3]